MSAIPLYVVPQVANIFDTGINARMHMIIASTYGRSNFRLFRRAQNEFDFLLRDFDRQPKILEGDLFLIVNDETNNTVIERPLVIENEPRAHYRCTFTADDTLDIQPGLYSWCIKYIDHDGIERILYTNQDYSVRGIMEVQDGFLIPLDDPFIINTFTPDNGGFKTSAYPGSIKANNHTGNHSIVLYLTNYTGTIYVDVSLDETTPVDDADWLPLTSFAYAGVTNTISNSFFGNFNFVRFRMTSSTGIEKIVYRN